MKIPSRERLVERLCDIQAGVFGGDSFEPCVGMRENMDLPELAEFWSAVQLQIVDKVYGEDAISPTLLRLIAHSSSVETLADFLIENMREEAARLRRVAKANKQKE